ncbi:cytoskeletal protein binding protein [Xylographa parallela]|nr:cytoskeletal protein binding protein [Xylographa parallela]
MDPISILTITQIACTISFQVVSTLYAFASDVKDLDGKLKGFTDEVEGLRRILIAITTSLNDPQLRLVESSTGKYGNNDMWEAIHGSVEDCRLYLEKLRCELSGIRKKKGEGNIIRQAIRALELRLNKDDINNLRSQVRSHQLGLNTALQMLNVYMCCRLPMQMQDSLAPQIATLGEAMAKLQTSIDDQSSLRMKPLAVSMSADATSINNGIQGSTHQILTSISNSLSYDAKISDSADQTLVTSTGSNSHRNVSTNLDSTSGDSSIARRLNAAALKIHSNASAISNARSTVWGGSERVLTSGSEWGEPLSLTARGNIEKWLSQPRTNGIAEEDDNSNVASSTLETSIFSHDKMSSSRSKETESDELDSDAEGELAADIVEKLLIRANITYEARAFTEAENIYRHALYRSKSISFTRKTKLNLKHAVYQLACACVQQKKLEEAKNLLLDLVQEYSLDSKHAYLILWASYVLGQIFVLERDFENAEMHCKRAVMGHRRMLGKDAKETYAAIQLLVVVYSSEFAPDGVKYEAEVWRDMLPQEIRDKDEKTERTFHGHDKEHKSSNSSINTTLPINTSHPSLLDWEDFAPHSDSQGSAVTIINNHAFTGLLDRCLVSQWAQNGIMFPPNAKMTQAWLIQNLGPLRWPVGCYVGFRGGNIMLESGKEGSEHTDHAIGSGEDFNFTVNVIVPQQPGIAKSYWQLCTAEGVGFGQVFWFTIMVTGLTEQDEQQAASNTQREKSDTQIGRLTEQSLQIHKAAVRGVPDSSKLRLWTDTTGSFTVEAEYLGCKDEKINLHKANGVKISVPIAKISTADLYTMQMETKIWDEEKNQHLRMEINRTDESEDPFEGEGDTMAQPLYLVPEIIWG